MATSTIKKVSSPDLEAKTRRNSFDWTNRRCFSALHGQLTPAFVTDLKTGDFVKLQSILHTRTEPISSVPYVRLREHLDWFFVPYAQLWKPYDNFKTQISSYDDTNLQVNLLNKVPSHVPYFSRSTFNAMVEDHELSFGIKANAQPNEKNDLHAYSQLSNIHRLAQYLGYFGWSKGALNVQQIQDIYTNYIPNVRFNLFRLAAYQKIYYDFYRNDKYESCDAEAYNLNDVKVNGNGTQGFDDSVSSVRLWKFFQMHYRWRSKDYFMSVTPNMLPYDSFIGFEGMISEINSFIISDDRGFYTKLQSPGNADQILEPSVNPASQDSKGGPNGGDFAYGYVYNDGNSYNTATTRLAFAYERLLKRMYASKSNFADQMRAIFGDAPIDYRGGFVQHLGGMSNILSFNATYQSSDGKAAIGTQFGQIDQKNAHKDITFRAHEDGVLMAIYSTSQDQDYFPFKTDRFNFKSLYEDYFNPHFQALGKQPILNIEYSNEIFDGTTGDHSFDVVPHIIGFTERYHEYKVPQDLILGNFTQGRENWVVPANYNEWNAYGKSLNQYNMTYSPNELNTLFYVAANSVRSGWFDTDQFDIEMVSVIDKQSEMDYIGDDL